MSSRAIGAIAPLARPEQQADVPAGPAAIQLNEPVTTAHVVAADAVVRYRKRACEHNSATDDEVVAAKTQRFALLREMADQDFPLPGIPAGPDVALGPGVAGQQPAAIGQPAWFAPALAAALEQALQPIKQDIQDLSGTVQDLSGTVQALSGTVNSMKHEQLNTRCRHLNSKTLLLTADTGAALFPIVKANTVENGHHFQLPGHPVPANQLPQLQNLAVGQHPADFPLTVGRLRSLTKPKLSKLAVAYGNKFGIVQGDSIARCIEMFERFIS